MPYFDRIRQLAAARGAPAGRRLPGLEIDDVRPAAPVASVPHRPAATAASMRAAFSLG